MKRLTRKSDSGMVWFIDREHERLIEKEPCEMDYHNNRIAIEKLAEYEDLEEQGKLPKLPCVAGDTVYAFNEVFGILEYVVESIQIDQTVTYLCFAYQKPIGDCPGECLDEIQPDISDFGKTVFLTYEEAVATLE